MISTTQAAIYLDDIKSWDFQDEQMFSGLTQSDPLVVGDDDEEDDGGIVLSGLVVIDKETTTGSTNTNPVHQLPELQRDAEFLMALRWIYDQGITKFQDPDQYMPTNYLTRIDAAKMLSILSRKVFGNTTTKNTNCSYTDITGYDDVTKGQVKDACELGIFKPATYFNPNQGITKGQLIAVLVRMFDQKVLDETVSPWYKNYVQRGWEMGLLQDTSLAGMEDVVARRDVAKLLYKLRNIHLNKTPITKSDDQLFMTILAQTGSQYQALINVDMIRDDKIRSLEMKLDPITYYFVKDKVYNYGSSLSNFQIYGYVYTSSEMITPVGVGTWRVQQNIVQEASLVIRGTPQTIYTVKPNEIDTNVYFITRGE